MAANDNYIEWIRFAEDDLESAKILANHYKPKIEISCYHSQQSAEKILKAFLLFNTIDFAFTHDLVKICSDCQKIDTTFSMIFNQCDVLNRYISRSRYPSPLEITEYDMTQAIKFADDVLSFVKDKISSSRVSHEKNILE